VPESFEDQVAAVYKNLTGILTANGMSWEHVIKTSVFIVAGESKEETNAKIAGFMTAWTTVGAFKSDTRGPPAATLLVVAGLADPRYLLEVEAEAVV
jgi:enamine deaminase RidA (YjgF/YER057c/UK114 family)